MTAKPTNRLAAALTAVLMAGGAFIGGRATAPSATEDMAAHAVMESRSSHWPRVRAEYLREHPVCEACGTDDGLNVHHVVPFSTDPAKELDLRNLITLCAGKRQCHLRIGHSFNFQCYNPHVRQDAALQRKRIRERVF